MKNAMESIKYRGKMINVYYDEDASSPDAWENDDVFLVGFHGDFTVERTGYDHDTIGAIIMPGKFTECIDMAAAIKKRYHVLPLEAYIHGGVSLYLAGGCQVDRAWDVSLLGAVLVEKTTARTIKKARITAQGLLDEWNDYLSGQVFGYDIEDGGGCWGFYGDEGRERMIEEAKAEIDADMEKKLKIWTTNRVPLEKRIA
jgi:hypothetical protein